MIVLDQIFKVFHARDGAKVNALKDVSLTVDEREFITIVGPSGCGKSTLCQWIRKNTDALVADESESPLLTAFYDDPKRWAFATQIDLLTPVSYTHLTLPTNREV